MSLTRGALLTLSTLFFGVGITSAQTVRDCSETRIEARRILRAQSDRNHHACMGNRECLKEAKAWWQAGADRIDDESALCYARARSLEKREPPPWANWKPGDPPPRAKDGRYYLMSCSGKVLGLYKPGGALEMELKTRGGSCHPSETWGDVNLLPKGSEWGYCRDGSWGHRSNGCVHASPPTN